MYQNGSKRGLSKLLASLVECKSTLTYVDIQDNKSINRSIAELTTFLKECKNVEVLNISDLHMKKKHVSVVAAALVESINGGS